IYSRNDIILYPSDNSNYKNLCITHDFLNAFFVQDKTDFAKHLSQTISIEQSYSYKLQNFNKKYSASLPPLKGQNEVVAHFQKNFFETGWTRAFKSSMVKQNENLIVLNFDSIDHYINFNQFYWSECVWEITIVDNKIQNIIMNNFKQKI
ncbi:MAG: hypothetical protein JHC93_08085, partial [Parachlamydiales bacterium]|nr:hypothetical protein [Parachlamydiales bacterium]